ncbi:MAG: hypothetical protein ACKOX7_03085 [Bacteroidota bacterium]
MKTLDKEGHYYITRCLRCSKEEVHFVREGAKALNGRDTLKVVKKCLADPHFVKCCIRYRKYQQIAKIENAVMRLAAINSFNKEYKIKPGEKVTNPMWLYRLNLWQDESKDVKKRSTQKKSKAPIKKKEVNSSNVEQQVAPIAKPERKTAGSKRPAIKHIAEMSKKELDRFLQQCLEKEAYEKAAIIKKEMDRRNGLL